MYCSHCGERHGDEMGECPACGRTVARAAGRQVASDLARTLGSSSSDAVRAVKALVLDPVGGLADSYEQLGALRARSVGALLCTTFALATSLGVVLGARQWGGPLLGHFGGTFELFVKSFALSLVLSAALVVSGLGVRKMFRASEGVAADLFTAGVALTPLSVAALGSGLVGLRSAELSGLLCLFALTYMVLVLYAGVTRVGGISPRYGAPAVPILIVGASLIVRMVVILFY